MRNGQNLTIAGNVDNTTTPCSFCSSVVALDFANNGNGASLTITGRLTNGPGSYVTLDQVGGGTAGGTLSAGSVSNSGTVQVNLGEKLNSTGTYAQAAGTTNVYGGNLNAPTVNVSGGTLEGAGTIQGNVTQTGGTLAPGDPTGTMTITGNLTLSGTTFLEQISGATAGTGYNVLDVSGALDFGASDLLSLSGGFTPTNGEVFDIINAGSVSGTFANSDIAFAGGSFDISYVASGCATGYAVCVDLTWNASGPPPAPEPPSAWLLGIVLLAFALAAGRRGWPKYKQV